METYGKICDMIAQKHISNSSDASNRVCRTSAEKILKSVTEPSPPFARSLSESAAEQAVRRH